MPLLQIFYQYNMARTDLSFQLGHYPLRSVTNVCDNHCIWTLVNREWVRERVAF